jgi:large subunit ribosomal protein L23
MRFFKDKKEKEAKEEVKQAPPKKVEKKLSAKKSSPKPRKVKKEIEPKKVSNTTKADLSWVLQNTRITEKAAYAAEKKVYVFNVDPRANKLQVKEAIEKKYKVSPIKVNVTAMKSKPKMRRGIKGKTAAGKKAYVYLNKKDNIEFV